MALNSSDFDDPFAEGFDEIDTTTGGVEYSSDPHSTPISSGRSSSSPFGAPSGTAPRPSSSSDAPSSGGFLSRFGFGSGDAGKKRDDGSSFATSGHSFRTGGLHAGLSDNEHRYLSFERRGLWGQSAYNVGYAYFSGLALGGLVGCVSGLRSAPNRHARIVLNSVLNGSGRYGARAGNAAGILAMVYTVAERLAEDRELDRLPMSINNMIGRDILPAGRWDKAVPAAAAFAMGSLFMLPRAFTMRGLDKHYISWPKRVAVVGVGGLLGMAGIAAVSVAGPLIYGKRAPFRFASS